jgi:FkbM family methyltransferase
VSESYTVKLKSGIREVSFVLNYDPSFPADYNTRFFSEIGCEPEVGHVMMKALRPGDRAVDAGANVGFFTLLMAKLVGPTGRVYAIEPHPENVRRLKLNIEANSLLNVEVIEKAAWETERDLSLYTSSDSGENSLRKPANATGSRTVSTLRLDSLPVPRLVKLDIEGAEVQALKGMAHWFTAPVLPIIVCELNSQALDRFGHTPKTIRRMMFDAGYDTYLPHADGILPVLLPGSTRLTNAPDNLMALFATDSQVGDLWSEYDVADHHRYRRPVLCAVPGPDGTNTYTWARPDAGSAAGGADHGRVRDGVSVPRTA